MDGRIDARVDDQVQRREKIGMRKNVGRGRFQRLNATLRLMLLVYSSRFQVIRPNS